jgi:hypothetical protein
MISTALLAALTLAGDFPGFQPPPSGIGAEVLPLSVRSLGMGGVSTGIQDDRTLCFSNPAASAWARLTGITWAAALREGDDEARDGRMSFPSVSVVAPLPWGVVLSAGLAERSSLLASERLTVTGYRAEYYWNGGLTEASASVSVLGTDWLAFSLGGRGTFGSIRSSVSLEDTEPGPGSPVATEFVDEALFRPSWGLTAGLFVKTGFLDLGASFVTDRSGTLQMNRDFAGGEITDSESETYDVPGEINLGMGLHPTRWLTLAGDFHKRKSFTIPGGSVPEGSVASAGAEALLGRRLALRAGYSSVSDLWRDGASIYSAGAGYTFGGGRAGLDLAVTREAADDFTQTGFFVSLFACEDWTGQ